MLSNRSLPTDIVLPHVSYRSVEDAIAWLTKVFGFTEHYRYGEPGAANGAQIYFGSAFLMLDRVRDGHQTPAQLGYGTQSLTIFVEDVEAHYHRAKSAGAKILEAPHETVYGEFQYAAEDLDGHHWLFSRHARDLSPDQWGATVAKSSNNTAATENPAPPRRVKTPRELVMPPVVYQLPGMDAVQIHANLKYSAADNPNLLMDVFTPSDATSAQLRPIVFFIHGSAGAEYKPKDWGFYQSWGRLVAAAGLIAVAFTHRMGYPKPLLQQASSDVRSALEFVRANAPSWHADPDRIGMIAWSGGGPLLSIVLKEKLPFVRCLLAFYALLDGQRYQPFTENEPAELVNEFSPINYLRRDPASIPPIFVARAGQDALPPINDSIDRFTAAALVANAPVALMNHPVGEHAFDNQNDDERSREIIRAALAFLQTHLR